MATDFAPHNMSNNTTPSPYVASASSETFPSYYAFDGGVSNNQYWLSVGPTGWLKIDIGAYWMLENYSVRVNTIPEASRAPKDWTMEGSNDNVNWDTLDTVVNQTGWSSGETRNFVCDTVASTYRYFRINITANNGDGSYTQVGELYLYGSQISATQNYLRYRGRDRFDTKTYSLGQSLP